MPQYSPPVLTTSVAVAHLYNGTVLTITKTPATPAYTALMERIGNAPEPPPPGRLAKWQRWWNKKRGQPATADVGVLSSLLISLKAATVSALGGQPVDRVAVTGPSTPALINQDLHDALEHAGLRSWLGDGSRYQPRRIAQCRAVFAGNGHGLCPSYTDLFQCWSEGGDMASRLTLFVSLTRHALYASVDEIREAFPKSAWGGDDGLRVLDFDGGLDGRGRFASEGDYWAHVRGRIVGLARQSSRPLQRVLLGGENATNSAFLATLRDALAELSPVSPLRVDVAMIEDPTYAAARGMAVYARRRQEVPGDCMERLVCDERREKERSGASEGSPRLELR
ncbi:hypothetical protein C8A01DRAFT_38228 [Parachaetomium inaequale]|uniref:Uncharacterized protein n=1 Tax=Parachaetomium inaequale TaxID=2588326 RepID=A0AAN6PBG2_9PEZI|nr:hypothetical protein C8A01DRAFT_38228 [Parachaetomium inaequale]